MSFDAKIYLRTHDPSEQYSVTQLSGGLVNFTYRATKKNNECNNTGSRYPYRNSIILKHAPPYMAAFGPSVPLGTQRQTTEATILQVFNEARHADQSGPLSELLKAGDVIVPKFLYHDDHNKVLIMEDLGDMSSLCEVFGPVGGLHQQADPQTASESLSRPFGGINDGAFRMLGERLGMFFRTLHSPDVRSDVEHILQERGLSLNDPRAQQTVDDVAIQPLRAHLKQWSGMLKDGEDAFFFDAVLKDFWRESTASELSFVLGDCWTGAILIDAIPAAIDSAGSTRLAVIDWEFAHFGRGINGDMAQLIAYLEVLRIAAAEPRYQASYLPRIEALLEGLVKSYRRSDAKANRPVLSLTERMFTTMRSAFLSTGTEILNCLSWKQWPCDHPRCPNNVDLPAIGNVEPQHLNLCPLLRKIAAHGIDHLRLAGKDIHDFAQNLNGGIERKEGPDRRLGQSGGRSSRMGVRRYWLLELFLDDDGEDRGATSGWKALQEVLERMTDGKGGSVHS